MHSAVTSAEITASAVMKISVLRRSRGKVTCEIHLGQQTSKRHKATPANPQRSAERCGTPAGADSPGGARTRQDRSPLCRNLEMQCGPAWLGGHLGGHNVRV